MTSTSITFETATIADAVRRAAKIAPGKAGQAFDKAAGLLFEINPGSEAACIIRATNLDAFHTELVASVHAEGEPARWRLPSTLLANVIGGLPPKSGATVRFTQVGTKVEFQQGRLKGTVMLMDEATYSDWDMFDSSTLKTVPTLGGRIAMVEWAASGDGLPPMCGVYLDGKYAMATDRYKVARVPLEIDLVKPILVPAGILGTSLKAMGDTGVGVSDTQLLLAPDDYTQLTTVLYDSQFPPVQVVFNTEYEEEVEVNRDAFIALLQRAGQYAGADRNPSVRTYWGKGELAVFMENSEIGTIGDIIELPTATHKRIQIGFSPKYLIDALTHAPDSKVKIKYHSTPENTCPTIYIGGGSGYECWVMKRKIMPPQM